MPLDYKEGDSKKDFTDFEEVDEASEPATTSVEPTPEVKEEEYKPKFNK